VSSARFYVDADALGLAHVLVRVRPDVTYPGDDGRRERFADLGPCPITDTATPDHVWIPAVARAGLVIITRDRHIESRPAEADAVFLAGAKMFTIGAREQLTVWDQLEIVCCRWRDIVQLSDSQGPFIYRITRTACTPVKL
jgi:hypothetical protein